MKTVRCAVALLVLAFAAEVHAAVAYSDYDGTNFQTIGAAAGIEGAGFLDYYDAPVSEEWSAFQFKSEVTGSLDSITVSLLGVAYEKATYNGYVNPDSDYRAKIVLYFDAADHLGGVMASWNAIGLATVAIHNYKFTNTDTALVLNQGQSYWIGVLPYSPVSCTSWYGAYAGQPETNYMSYYENRDGTGAGPDDTRYSTTTAPGTMLVAVTPLPEPATLSLLTLGGLALLRRRRR
jgi:hypothetical protein